MGKSFVYNTGSSSDDKREDEIRLEFGVFIDGTLNNKDNTDLRNKYSRGEGRGGNIDYSKSTATIEAEEEKAYSELKNKSRTEELMSKEKRTPAEENEYQKIDEKTNI
jgi:hypothetical protein